MKNAVVLKVADKVGMNQYLLASEAYFKAKPYTSMEYTFPAISGCCPVCEGSECAIWKGYYTRYLFCSEIEYVGPVAIHWGRCKKTGLCFSVHPSFLFRTEGSVD